MRVDWHQDGAYWPLEPMNVITLWLAVDRSDRDNGCLKVVRGTHKDTLKVRAAAGQNREATASAAAAHASLTGPHPRQSLQKSADNVLGSSTHTNDDINQVGTLLPPRRGPRPAPASLTRNAAPDCRRMLSTLSSTRAT